MQAAFALKTPVLDMEPVKPDGLRRYRASSANPKQYICTSGFSSTGLIPPNTWDVSVPLPPFLDQNEEADVPAERGGQGPYVSNMFLTWLLSTAILALPVSALKGSGMQGADTSAYSPSLRGYSVVRIQPSESEEILASGASAMLHEAKAIFHLPIADLARLLGVSRPTVYGYLQDKDIIPLEDTRARIIALHEYANKARAVSARCGGQMRHLLKRPLFEGLSLFDLMLQGKDIDAPLQALLRIHQNEEQMSRKLAARFKGRPVIATEDDVSIPSAVE